MCVCVCVWVSGCAWVECEYVGLCVSVCWYVVHGWAVHVQTAICSSYDACSDSAACGFW